MQVVFLVDVHCGARPRERPERSKINISILVRQCDEEYISIEIFVAQIAKTHCDMQTDTTMNTTYRAIINSPMDFDIFHLKPAMEAMTMKSMSRIVTQSQAIPIEDTRTLET